MVKKTILSYWFKKINPQGNYETLKNDKITYIQLSKKYETFKIRAFFLTVFLLSFIYIMFIKSELYESKAAIMVRDLSQSSPVSSLGLSLLGASSGSQHQDSMVVEEYLNSLDIFLKLDKKFHLIQHYKSDAIDFIQRLPQDVKMEEILEFYHKNLLIEYDEISSILHISFLDTNPKKAQEILNYLISQAEFALNEFNRKKAQKRLKFVELEHKKNKEKMEKASAILEKYQNDHLLLDPKAEASTSISIIAELETSLTQKRIEYKTKSAYLNPDNYELKKLKTEIQEIEKSLAKAKKGLTGNDKNRLNSILFQYEKLKLQFEFAVEVYKTSLVELETTKLDAIKAAKTLSIVSQPNLPDGYTYPNKPKDFITLTMVILLMYGIFSMLLAIIKDHKE